MRESERIRYIRGAPAMARGKVDMTTTSGVGCADSLPQLELIDQLDVFVPGAIQGRVRITQEQPLTGELIRDSTGRYFLAPEEDYRGGGIGSVPVIDLPAAAKRRLAGKVVRVAGVYEGGVGITIEAIAAEGKDFQSQ